MKIDSDAFRIHEGATVGLGKWPSRVAPTYESKEQYHAMLADHVK
jgi:hypothetical protein